MMKVSLFSCDVHMNNLGRVYVLAKMLQRHGYETEIIGPMYGDGVWQPVADDTTIVYKTIKMDDTRAMSFDVLAALADLADGDVLYAVKPWAASFGAALLAKLRKRRPLVLDIDDWEMSFANDALKTMSLFGRMKYLAKTLFAPLVPFGFWNAFWCERLMFLADAKTVSNRFLRKKFGGTIVVHARDTEMFSPQRYASDEIRRAHGIALDAKVVMFFGSICEHKGVDRLVDAIVSLDDHDVRLVLVGVDLSDPYARSVSDAATARLGERYRCFGFQPFAKVPEFLSIADVVVVPQQKNDVSRGQLPAKFFDAMAMGKVVVTTDVGDAREVFADGCGVIAGEGVDFATAIAGVLADPESVRAMGLRARQKCVDLYGYATVGGKVADVIRRVCGKRGDHA
jgi:glycosyltransferase involved in cell wall biosynthesis